MFERNMGTLDRVIRFVLAVAVTVVAIFFQLYELLILSVFLVFTVVTSFCGVYKLFGLKTCPNEVQQDKKS